MKPDQLFECAEIIKALGSEMKSSNTDMDRVVLWSDSQVALSRPLEPNNLRYVDAAHESSSVLIDPRVIPNCENQVKGLEDHGLLEKGFHDHVMMITVRLNEQIEELNADLTINREVIHTVEEFRTVREIWDRFSVDPMNSFSWHLSWWQAFQTHGDLHLMTFERNGRIVGIAPFYVDRWFGLRRLRFLATGDACTDYIDIICDNEHYELCTYSLAEYIREQNFDVVELECTRDDRLALLLKQHLDNRYRFDHRLVEPTWRLDLPGEWNQFVSSSKKSLRRKINKAVRRIESGDFDVQSTSTGLHADSAFDLLKDLHTQRFNSMGKPGVFGDKQFEEFIRSAFIDFHQQGVSEIITARTNGKPIAAQLYFISEEGFQLYQSGYLPEAMHLEPGHLLFTVMLNRAITRGDHCFDFLRGNEAYKEFWGAKPHIQMKLRMVAKRVLPSIVSRTVESVRQLVRGKQASQ